LFFALTVNAEMEVSRYSFHSMTPGKGIIWRKDNAHEQYGEHIHRKGADPAPYPAVDLDEALQEVTAYIHSGTVP
jgi:Family of unknown function (DUF6516)